MMILKKLCQMVFRQNDLQNQEMQRLYYLENAFINYSGGVLFIIKNTLARSAALEKEDPATSRVLHDIATYLNAVVLAGQLDIQPRTLPRKKNTP